MDIYEKIADLVGVYGSPDTEFKNEHELTEVIISEHNKNQGDCRDNCIFHKKYNPHCENRICFTYTLKKMIIDTTFNMSIEDLTEKIKSGMMKDWGL
jgi:hypothetical protein